MAVTDLTDPVLTPCSRCRMLSRRPLQAVKLARQLLREEEEDDEEGGVSGRTENQDASSSSAANGVTAMTEDTI